MPAEINSSVSPFKLTKVGWLDKAYDWLKGQGLVP